MESVSLIGKCISHFKITAKLGEGGIGEVYRGEDTELDREVAIKVLPPDLAEVQSAVKLTSNLRNDRQAVVAADSFTVW